jgi:hypothetical protein
MIGQDRMAAGVGVPETSPGWPLAEAGERFHRARLHYVARILHDDIGPALCAAGLHLDLLRRDLGGREPAESAAALHAALEHAVERVRLLSYEAVPDLAARHGLERACRTLAGSRSWLTLTGEASPALSPGAAQALYELLLEVVLRVAPAPGAHLALTAAPGWTLRLSDPIGEPAGLALRAARSGLAFSIETTAGGGGTTISAAWPGGGQP